MPPATESMRDRILAAAIRVIRDRGIVAATTKEIARTAGVSEGSLYNHFANKSALYGAALAEVSGEIRDAMIELMGSVGLGTVEDNLTRLAATAVRFYGRLLPMTGPVLGDPDLLAWLRSNGPTQTTGTPQSGGVGVLGPVRGHATLIGYLEAEQRAGRIVPEARVPFIAAALLGGCQQHAFLTKLAGPEAVEEGARVPVDPDEFARGLVEAVLAGHLP